MEKRQIPPEKMVFWLRLATVTFWIMISVMVFSAIPSAYQSAWDYRQMRVACQNYPDIVYTCRVACPLFHEKEGLELTGWNEYYNNSFKRPTSQGFPSLLSGGLNISGE